LTLKPEPTPAPPRAGPAAESFRLSGHLFYFFSQIMALRNRRLNVALRAFGLDYARWRVLAVLNEQPGCSMQQLADTSSVDRTSLTHTLRLMEAEGLIRREQRASDRRSVALTLTDRGAALLEQILPTVLRQTELALTGFGADEAEALGRQLKRMADNLKE
jgi:DNA-binding MarR family transcriptional regulator